MKFTAAENVSPIAIALLRNAGYDVLSVRETASGSSDYEVLQQAVTDSRILITHDKSDFGQLILSQGVTPPPGLILFRIPGIPSEEQPYYIANFIQERADWTGFFWVIGERKIRRIPFTD